MIVILWHCASKVDPSELLLFKSSLTGKPYGFFSDDTADLPIYNKDPSQVVFKSGGSE